MLAGDAPESRRAGSERTEIAATQSRLDAHKAESRGTPGSRCFKEWFRGVPRHPHPHVGPAR